MESLSLSSAWPPWTLLAVVALLSAGVSVRATRRGLQGVFLVGVLILELASALVWTFWRTAIALPPMPVIWIAGLLWLTLLVAGVTWGRAKLAAYQAATCVLSCVLLGVTLAS